MLTIGLLRERYGVAEYISPILMSNYAQALQLLRMEIEKRFEKVGHDSIVLTVSPHRGFIVLERDLDIIVPTFFVRVYDQLHEEPILDIQLPVHAPLTGGFIISRSGRTPEQYNILRKIISQNNP